ncbi:Cell division protein DedD (protein involved in septation) [Kaistia soli DSM 19436]|uniref:Cell division protein DedD (Protein involved in septation) n=1 Tax=Kaistia soli DSM 19436 TaxID=1122133 RepID=A0A1M5GNS1_9HYPH|nr:SPOR domain-containing protein [Kaistia soli]SHG05343.1 Cell division protein DedD (protein involved in septation) [Kaistia soli DSM 19436]
MADRFDKSFARRPSGEVPRRDDAADLPEDDPLVELARIVSGNESFDQILGSRYQPQDPPRQASPRSAQPPRDTSFDLEAELLNDLHSSFDPAARPVPRAPEPRAPDPRLSQPRAPEPVRAPSRAADPAPRADDFDHMAVRPGAPIAPPRAAIPAAPAPEAYVAAPDFGRGRVSETMQRRPAAQPAPPLRDDDDYGDDYIDDEDLRADYEDGDNGYLDEPDFEGEPPRRSRKALITVGVVLAVLVAGGLGALALKGRSSVSGGGTPQVIAADQSPTKVEPEVQPTQNQDTQQNKLIYDRADPDTASPDQLQIPDNGTADATAQSNESQASREISRIILPGGPGDQSSSPAVPGGVDNTVPNTGDDSGPRKVRTVVVKPDGTIVSSEAAPRGATPAANTNAPASTDAASATSPTALQTPAADGADTAPSTAADDTAPAMAAPAKDASQLSAPAAAAPEVAAAPTPVPATPEPAAPAATPSSGGFVVQVSSQRSEGAAQTAYKSLQRKFPSLMGDREPDIAKADLGAKGVYYRVRVGPMATRDEAVNFCEQLRAAGGTCIVQKN